MQFALRLLAIAYLASLLGVWACMFFDDGTSWWVTLFLFSPRWVVGLPLLLLVPLTLANSWRKARWRLISSYLLHCSVLLFPILGFQLPEISLGKSEINSSSLRIFSCNLGEGEINVDQLVAVIKYHKADVVMLEECPGSISGPLFQKLGWNSRQKNNMAIGSALPLGEVEELASQSPEHFNATVSIACHVELPRKEALKAEVEKSGDSQRVRLVAIHFPTFRPAFEKARSFDGAASSVFEQLRLEYRELAAKTLRRIEADSTPTIIAGDFNVPIESAFYRDYWQRFENALTTHGFGLCYTKFTRLHGIRIDHVIADSRWTVNSAHVAASLGGDHRPVIVELVLTSLIQE